MKWFVEESNFKGEWVPVTYDGKTAPTEKTLGGARKRFRAAPKEVAERHEGLPLADLVQIYGAQDGTA
jgi:hypothetical protein